ncbi:MAG: hypothetical protein Q8O76_11000, partial [Chloroflexota bacterium]|nr:hypothetical protein [Chloroflexota bacterium]
HHRTVIFLLPVVAVYLASVQWPFWKSSKELGKLALLVFLPLVLYLDLPLRSAMHPPFMWTRADNLRGFLDLTVAGGTGENLRAFSKERLSTRLDTFLDLARHQLTPLGCALALLGGLVLVRRDKRNALLVALPALGVSALSLVWTPVPGKLNPVFLLPALPLYALLAGQGIGFLGERAAGKRAWAAPLGAAALLLYLGYAPGYASFREISARRALPLDNFRQELRGEGAEAFALATLKWAEEGALIAADWEQTTPLRYYQLVEGKRPDLRVSWPITGWRESLAQARSQGRKLYLARALPELVGVRYLTNAGPLVEVREGPELPLPTALTPAQVQLEDKL